MQEAPKQRGINREIEMPLENQMGTMCRNFFWRETSGKPVSYCAIVALIPSLVNTMPFDAPVVPEE